MEGEVLTTRLPGKSLNSFNKKVLHKKFFENSGVIKIKEAEIIAKTAAAAKSLQSHLTLCDPIDGSPPDSPVAGILQARTLEWVAMSFSSA